jgi:hypothetical protein
VLLKFVLKILKFVLKILNVAFVCTQVEFAMPFKNRREVWNQTDWDHSEWSWEAEALDSVSFKDWTKRRNCSCCKGHG